MKHQRLILILIAVYLTACHHIPEITLDVRTCPSPPEGRASAICFAIEDTVYILGGRNSENQKTSTLMKYSHAKQTWSEVQPTPLTARVNGVAYSNANIAYVGLGYTGASIYEDKNHLRDWWKYNPKTQQWTRLADFPTNKTVSAVAFGNDQCIWVGFGFNGFSDELWCYSIEDNEWREETHQKVWPRRLMGSVATSVGNRHYLGTGYRRHAFSEWWEWLEEEHCWESRSPVPGKGRHNAACAATSEVCWVIGGWHYGDSLTNGFHYADILRYSPLSDQWTVCGTIPCGGTENGVACGIGNTLYFGLGENEKGELHQKWYSIEE